MLGKLFRRKDLPKNSGERASSSIEELSYSKVFELELSNMEGSPLYPLEHRLTIGSEIGDILIADPSVSPRHASFILQEEIVSVIDHGSIAGTMVNGTKIPSGKYIILEERDVVNVGDLEFRFKVRTEARPAEKIPQIPIEKSYVEQVPDEGLSDEGDIPEFHQTEKNLEKKFDPKAYLANTKKPKAKKKFQLFSKEPSADDKQATNSLVRVLAVLTDLIFSYSLLVIFMPYDDVREFFQFIPNLLLDTFEVNWAGMWEAIKADYEFVGVMVEDAINFFSSTFHVGPLLLMFILNRLLFTLLLGVSLSEFMFGVKARGNGVWIRVGGVLRVLVGVITGPFILFDIPAIVSRRTFKELLTFTHTYVSSKFITILGILLFFPMMIALALLSPLIQGFEPPSPIIVNDKIEHRMKVKRSETTTGNEASAPLINDQSSYYGMKVTYDPKEFSIFPGFKFSGAQSKLRYQTKLQFYDKELKRSVSIEVFKNFDLKALLGIGIRNNPFLYEKYPEIYNFTYSAGDSSIFKGKTDLRSQMAFGQEIIQLTKTSFELSLENALDVMQETTPLIKGLVDYKASFLSLLEYKNFDQIGFIKIGNILFLKISFVEQRPFDLIIPLRKTAGQIFKITFDKREAQKDLSSKFYKYHLENSDWIADMMKPDSEVMTSMQALDLLSESDLKEKLSIDQAQALYAYYFETSARVLSQNDQTELNLWKESANSFTKIIQSLPDSMPAPGEEDPKAKLQYNFRDLMDALENKNFEYFGISQSAQI